MEFFKPRHTGYVLWTLQWKENNIMSTNLTQVPGSDRTQDSHDSMSSTQPFKSWVVDGTKTLLRTHSSRGVGGERLSLYTVTVWYPYVLSRVLFFEVNEIKIERKEWLERNLQWHWTVYPKLPLWGNNSCSTRHQLSLQRIPNLSLNSD